MLIFVILLTYFKNMVKYYRKTKCAFNAGGIVMKNALTERLSIKKSIGARITVYFFIIALSITAALSVVLYWQSSAMVVKDASDRAIKTANEAGRVIDINEFVKLNTVENEKKVTTLK